MIFVEENGEGPMSASEGEVGSGRQWGKRDWRAQPLWVLGSSRVIMRKVVHTAQSERQGDSVRDPIQILDDLRKPETSWSKLAFPGERLGRFARSGSSTSRPRYVDFATTVATEVTGKSY